MSAVLVLAGCGGNGSAPPHGNSQKDPPAAQGMAYPVYVPVAPQQYGTAQPPVGGWGTPAQGGGYAPPVQPGQQYPAQQYPAQQYPAQQYPAQQYPAQQYPAQQYPAQQYPAQQYPAQQYPAQQVAPQYVPGGSYGSDNPWAAQAHRPPQVNSWATSQPWGGGTVQQPSTGGRFRPLEGEETKNGATKPPAAPYDQVYGSSQRPVPSNPYYGGYAGGYPGGYQGGYYGGYPGVGGWPGATPYTGVPGMGWPGAW